MFFSLRSPMFYPARKSHVRRAYKARRSGAAYRHPRRTRVATPGRALSMVPMRKTAELKYADIQQHQTDVIDTGTFILLNGIGQGLEAYNRVGRQILMKQLDLKLSFTQQNGAVNAQQLRYMVVYDRQSNGAVFTNANLLDNSVALLWWTRKPTNPDNRDRFEILLDRTLQINPTLLEQSAPVFDHRLQLTLPTQYNGAGATVASITTGSLYLVFFDQAPLGLINIKTSFATRIHYLDA